MRVEGEARLTRKGFRKNLFEALLRHRRDNVTAAAPRYGRTNFTEALLKIIKLLSAHFPFK